MGSSNFVRFCLVFSPICSLMSANDFYYSAKYEDDEYEYRHVHVTKEVAKLIPKNRLMSESEWRSLGIQQSPGWIHYMIHSPERHVLLFRRPLPKPQITEKKRGKQTISNCA
ncbi:unnamed protein product [Auanema sp. JU1783]|nr:unnamed protein product [Auanema sp. JU1783]